MLRDTPIRPTAVVSIVIASLAGCQQPMAHGDANALIVATSTELWGEVEDVFREAMTPTIQAVTNEQPFRLTHQDPTQAGWGNLQRFRQVLVLGSASEPWVQEVLAVAKVTPTPPQIVQAQNVWARGQLISLVLLPETGQAAAVAGMAGELHTLLDAQFRQYARDRMFVSGTNQALADSLATNVGFRLEVPLVYTYTVRDSVFRFRNDNPSPAELIREVAVTWRSPAPEGLPAPEELAEWRPPFTEAYYNDAQALDPSVVTSGPIQVEGLQGVEYQSAWVSPPGAWPAGGPFITRAIACPAQNRLYLMDAWLYAPNKDKYEYMIQLETILDSFRCP